MRTALGLLCVAAGAAAVLVGYQPATSYVYRSDSGGPASLVRLGHGPALEALDLAPVPLPYINAKPIAVEDAEEDDEDEEDGDYVSGEEGDDSLLAHGHEGGGGGSYGEEHHGAHGEKGSEGHASKEQHAKGAAGDYAERHDEGFYREGGGEKGAHHDAASAHGAHHAAGKGYKGGDHGYKKHSSKGEAVTGYHKVFNKNEFKKDHDFYDEAAKDGHFQKHGHRSAHHGAEKGAHEKGGRGEVGYNKGGFGKAGFHKKGRADEEDEGHSAEEGADSYYHESEGYGKKGAAGKHHDYGYAEHDGHDDDE